MKILFISYLSQPHDWIGAVRPTNMSCWLAELGHEVTLVTENPRAREAVGKAEVLVVRHSRVIQMGIDKLAARAAARKAAGVKPHAYAAPAENGVRRKIFTKEMFYTVRIWVWEWLCQQDWAWRCRRALRRDKRRDYDAIISSFGPLGSLLAGRWARRKGLGRVWLADMRDPIANNYQFPLFKAYSRALERQTVRRCDRLIVMSDGAVGYFRAAASNPRNADKVTLLENGYEYGTVEDTAPADGVLRIGYTGRFYPGRSDFTAALEAAAELTKSGRVPAGGIQIHYAGQNGHEFMEAVKTCHAEFAAVDHGLVPRDEAVALQSRCDILCVLSWNTRDSQGILTGKFWEYLRARKPVLSLVTGDVPQAELTCRVRDMQLGFAYEYVQPEPEQLQEYLYSAWLAKSRGEKNGFSPDWDKVLDYRYDNRARRMETIALDALRERGNGEL